jgi:hypothetical protein
VDLDVKKKIKFSKTKAIFGWSVLILDREQASHALW